MGKHIVIVGEKHVGKSTLIQKLLTRTGRPAAGIITKMVPTGGGRRSIYIFDAAQAVPEFDELKAAAKASAGDSDVVSKASIDGNKVGECGGGNLQTRPQVFDELGVEFLSGIPSDSIIVMDELGFLEDEAELFKEKVLEIFAGEIPIIAAVKSGHETEFLETLRTHPNAHIYKIDRENRDELVEAIVSSSDFKEIKKS